MCIPDSSEFKASNTKHEACDGAYRILLQVSLSAKPSSLRKGTENVGGHLGGDGLS